MIPIEKFGKDHWSTFGYIETRIVDHDGIPHRHHMRCDPKRHPFQIHSGANGKLYPTILTDNEQLPDHDDWDCLDDCVDAGLLKEYGTGLYPRYRLTDKGRTVAAALRAHKAKGQDFAAFQWLDILELVQL